jgi:hypothetical protein
MFFFYKIGGQEGRTQEHILSRGLVFVPVGGGRCQGKGIGGWTWYMYANAKMIPAETIPEMGGRMDKGEL